jgi:hypothetical protein
LGEFISSSLILKNKVSRGRRERKKKEGEKGEMGFLNLNFRTYPNFLLVSLKLTTGALYYKW